MSRLDCVVELLFFSSSRIIIVILGPWHRKLNRYTLAAYFCRNNRNKLQPYSAQSINPYVSSSAFISTFITTTQATAGFLAPQHNVILTIKKNVKYLYLRPYLGHFDEEWIGIVAKCSKGKCLEKHPKCQR